MISHFFIHKFSAVQIYERRNFLEPRTPCKHWKKEVNKLPVPLVIYLLLSFSAITCSFIYSHVSSHRLKWSSKLLSQKRFLRRNFLHISEAHFPSGATRARLAFASARLKYGTQKITPRVIPERNAVRGRWLTSLRDELISTGFSAY